MCAVGIDSCVVLGFAEGGGVAVEVVADGEGAAAVFTVGSGPWGSAGARGDFSVVSGLGEYGTGEVVWRARDDGGCAVYRGQHGCDC